MRLPSGGADDAGDAGEPSAATPGGTVGETAGERRSAHRPRRPRSTTDVEVADASGATPAVADSHADGHGIHLPSPSYYPLVVAAGLPCLGYAAVFNEILWLIPGLILLLFGVFAWGLEPGTEEA